jgi:large subunit ribosomal protein L13
MITKSAKLADINRRWHLVDVKDQVLGRSATQIAQLLMGKAKANYSPHMDMGDYVVVINSDDIQVTGKKTTDKLYYRHSGFPGGFRKTTLGEQMDKDSRKVISSAVKGMLPKNKLQARYMARLKIFAGNEHSYQNELKTE